MQAVDERLALGVDERAVDRLGGVDDALAEVEQLLVLLGHHRAVVLALALVVRRHALLLLRHLRRLGLRGLHALEPLERGLRLDDDGLKEFARACAAFVDDGAFADPMWAFG